MFYYWVFAVVVLVFFSGSGDQEKLKDDFDNRQAVPEPSLIGGLLVAGILLYTFKKRRK